jgi:hypothetical protein
MADPSGLQTSRVTRWLSGTNAVTFSVYCSVASFGTYFCMYACRKPFAAGTYEELELWGVDYKIILIVAQIFGYTLSKFIGIKVIAEMPPTRRVLMLLSLMGVAQGALLCLGLVPVPYNFVFMFLNGIPLGMVYGVVFSFLEGRRFTEVLVVALGASFVASSGVVKAVGRYTLVEWEVPEFWMPFVTGSLFIPPLLCFSWMLAHIPAPTKSDVALRTARVPMDHEQRVAYFKAIAPGLILLIVAHMLMTACRDIRDSFAVEILDKIGYGEKAANLWISEVPVAFTVLVLLGCIVLIRNNRWAFAAIHGFMFLGVLLAGVATVLFEAGRMDPFLWFMATGLGVFLAYVPFSTILFDRLIAVFRNKSNAGYFIYIADATGYLASVLVLLYKNFGASEVSWLSFFKTANYVLAIVGGVLILLAFAYFWPRSRSEALEEKT